MSQRVQIGKPRGVVGASVSATLQALLALSCIGFAVVSAWALSGGEPTIAGIPLVSASLRRGHQLLLGTLAASAFAAVFTWSFLFWLRAPARVDVGDDGSWSLRNALGLLITRIPTGSAREVEMKLREGWGNSGMGWCLVIRTDGRSYKSMTYAKEPIGVAYRGLQDRGVEPTPSA